MRMTGSATLARALEALPPGRYTRETQRKRIIECYLRLKAPTYAHVQRVTGCCYRTVHAVISQWESTGKTTPSTPGPKRGSHQQRTEEGIATTVHDMTGKSGCTLKQASLRHNISVSTTRRAAHKAGVSYGSGKRGRQFTEAEKANRLAFARRHEAGYAGIAWKDGAYPYATPLYASAVRGKSTPKFWARAGEHGTVATYGHSLKAMVYACITRHGPGPLVYTTGTSNQQSMYKRTSGKQAGTPYDGCCGAEYKNDVLPTLRAHCQGVFGNTPWLYVHDRASIHSSANTQMRNDGQPHVADWPTKGYDIMPIENAWSALQEEVAKRRPEAGFRSMMAFKACIDEAWLHVMTPAYCKKLVGSVRGRLKKVKGAKGAYIGY